MVLSSVMTSIEQLSQASQVLAKHVKSLIATPRAEVIDGNVSRDSVRTALLHAAGGNNYDVVAAVISILVKHKDSLVEARTEELREVFGKLKLFLKSLDNKYFRLTVTKTEENQFSREEKHINFTYSHKNKELSGSFVLESGVFDWSNQHGEASVTASIIKNLVFNNIKGSEVDDDFVGRCLDPRSVINEVTDSLDTASPYTEMFAAGLNQSKHYCNLNTVERFRGDAMKDFIMMMTAKARRKKLAET